VGVKGLTDIAAWLQWYSTTAARPVGGRAGRARVCVFRSNFVINYCSSLWRFRACIYSPYTL